MSKTYDSFVLLRAVALTVGLAVTMWSLGIPSLQLAQAANLTSLSDTVSDSGPSASADHTIEFVTPSGLDAGGDITVTLADFGNVTNITASDIALDISGSPATLADGAASGATWGVNTTATEIVLTSGTETIGGNATVTIQVGENAGGTNQITNPGASGSSYPVQVSVDGNTDSGETRVAIIDEVTVSAAVDTVFTFTVAGVAGGQTVNGTSTTGSSTATSLAFGTLEPGVATTTAQDLTVTTNAANGFVVTVQTDQPLQSSTGAVIEGFVDGSYTTTPTTWASPGGDVNQISTWGHWGLTSDDATVDGSDIFDVGGTGNLYVAASTSPVAVFTNDGPADGSTQNIGSARVGYQVEISPLQPAGDDYTTTLTYVATPVF